MSFKYAIVLTGGIATGKSTVAGYFKNRGFIIIDADTIAHEVLDEQYIEVARLFGESVITDKKVNRRALGSIVFENQQERQKLESLLHPLIFKKIEGLSKEEDEKRKPYLIDIPLFFESNRYPIKKSLVVYADKERQIKRLMKRDGYNKDEALLRIESQLDIEEKVKKASYVIRNIKDKNYLEDECQRVEALILGEFNDSN
ncbi:MAG: Dephospho-CoA kinase (EC [uncultured Sulfurovum sp.]|uniref:Dephospho-CoA kinase n=1 Tax=uncultured Sulfurovum sp. TaxID=269237 RepID=A0A6S6S3V0_9BACT|nr:MAG: Dephospho-CoA kinase (EC [uncultured Sulfurovum sp.]